LLILIVDCKTLRIPLTAEDEVAIGNRWRDPRVGFQSTVKNLKSKIRSSLLQFFQRLVRVFGVRIEL
jgi:hypothetical protein